MQKYQEKPIPLVLRDQIGKYRVNQEALELFMSIEGKLAIISVAGIYRTGKSFLLNTILLNIKSGFAVGPTVNPKTKGIWVWGKPLIFKNQHDEIINVLVLDSEGLGSTEEDINHDLRLFSITLLMSSAFLYNTVGAIDENAIDRLGLVLRLCEHLKSENYNDFPDFYWILRDFSLALVDKNNFPLTTKAYLENCLSNQPGDSEYRNKIRQSIKQAFDNRQCFTFVRPLMNEESLQNLDKMKLEQLRPQFVEEVINFRKSIFSNLRVKSIKGRDIKGPMLCELVNIYVECINSDKLPVIESGWEQLCLKELHEVLYDIEEAVSKRVRDIKDRLPRSKKQLMKEQQSLMDEFQEIFDKRLKNNDRAKEYFKSVEEIIAKELKGVEEEMKVKNSVETQAFVRKQFESIEKRLKQNEFKNMGQLAKQFQIFYEYYRKKCPYKDEIQTGLELLIKKFSDCSIILSKNINSKKDIDIDELKKQIDRITGENGAKQEKLKQERNTFQDKVVKLEANVSELKKQNNQLTKMLDELEMKLEIAENMNNNGVEEELTKEIYGLKKKILDMEDKEREMTCLHSQEMNGLKQELLLKTNQAQNSQKHRKQQSTKLDQLQTILKNTKQLSQQKIHELILQLEQLAQKANNQQRSLKLKLNQKDQLIDELQRTVELKMGEITQIHNKNSQESSILSEMLLQEERKCMQEKDKEIQNLRKQLVSVRDGLENRVKLLEAEIGEKEMQFKIGKLSVEQEKALLVQKIQFIQRESEEKIHKNQTLQLELQNYVQMIEQKDEEIESLTNQIEDLKSAELSENQQIQKKIVQMANQIQQRNSVIKNLQAQISKVTERLNKNIEEQGFRIEELNILLEKSEDEVKRWEKQVLDLKKNKQEADKDAEENAQTMRIENQRYLEDQKRNAELSLVQLKNYYEMEKERLEKRLLQQRKKYEYNEANMITELKNKYTKQIRNLTAENNDLNAKLEEIQEEMAKSQNQYEIRIVGLEEDLENERKSNQNRFDILKKKYDDAVEDLEKIQKVHEEDRISFLKKIESLNFQISKKEKEILQINVKKESLETTISKKQAQLQNIKKTMHQQIESSLKRVSETQAKYQKINEEYSKFKIEAEKENALLNQRNQFLNARLTQMSREKDTGSLKNLEKAEKNKVMDLKQQLDRQKSENMSLQAKIQNLRKTEKETSSQYKKQINELEKDNMFLKQKVEINESKITELEIKLNQKTEMFKKQVDDMRSKYNAERTKLQNELDSQRDKSNTAEDEKKQKIFKLQMQVALATDRIKNVETQRDQNKKELEETEKRLQNALNQIKKHNEKGLENSQMKKNSVDKRYSNQLELMKMSSKVRQQELEEGNKRLKEEMKALKEKNFEMQEKLNRLEKTMSVDKNLSDEIEKLKRQKQQMIMAHRNELQKQIDQWKRKNNELEKKNRQIEKQNNSFVFILEKEKAKHNTEKQELTEKLKQVQEQLNWELKRVNEPKNRVDPSKSKKFSMTASDVIGGWH